MDDTIILDIIFRLILSGICGVVVGIERQRRDKYAGVRTHFIVCLASALTMVVSKYGYFDIVPLQGEGLNIKLDPSRIAAGTVTAVGFLGAGTIIVKKKAIHGLTTAAGIWAMVGVGLSIGAGLSLIGVITTIIILLGSTILHIFFKYNMHLNISFENLTKEEILEILDPIGYDIKQISYTNKDNISTTHWYCFIKRDLDNNEICQKLTKTSGVVSFELE